ncbi:MAG TPA: tetratricopeptide repeat-containing diguanylate cyclase [Longimicrobium sp.]|nr:tetratricopeptide repeat-containing diguanylate cyclase [Longimicrobium sp.]
MRYRLFVTVVIALAAAAPLQAQRAPDPRALLARAEELQDVDDEGALRLVNQALPLLQRPEDQALRLKALAMQCWSSAGVIEPDAQVALAERGMAQARAAGDASVYADLRVCRGYAHDSENRAAEALADFDFGVNEGRRLRDDRVLATALLLRGQFRYYRGELGGALEDLNESYALYSRLRDESRIRIALSAVANVYADERVAQYDRAIEYYKQVLASNQAADHQENVATAYYNLGSTLERKGDLNAALNYYRRALELERRLGDAGEVAGGQRAIGVLLGKMGRNAEALSLLNEALSYYQREGDAEWIAITRLSRGVALRRVGRVADALADLDAAAAHFRAARNDRYLERVQAERAQAFAEVGDWRQAYEARGEQIALQSALAARLREETTSQLRVRFDSERKEQENRALVRENADAARIRRLQTAVIALTLAIIGILAWLTVRHLRTARLMRTMALTDELTRLPNRRHLLSVAAERVDGARQGTGPLSVLALDIDHFKRINDTFGHEVGDKVLHRVAATCRAALRRNDVIGRTGGEEFVVVMPDADAKIAVEVAERLRAAVEAVDWSELDPKLRVTVSVGATEWMPGDDGFAAVARRADESLYRAKERGRNRIELAGAGT